ETQSRAAHQLNLFPRAARSIKQEDQIEQRLSGCKAAYLLSHAIFEYREIRSLEHIRTADAVAIGHDQVNRDQVSIETDRAHLVLFVLLTFVFWILGRILGRNN